MIELKQLKEQCKELTNECNDLEKENELASQYIAQLEKQRKAKKLREKQRRQKNTIILDWYWQKLTVDSVILYCVNDQQIKH